VADAKSPNRAFEGGQQQNFPQEPMKGPSNS